MKIGQNLAAAVCVVGACFLLLLFIPSTSGQSRIVGGQDADLQRFPFYTSLISSDGSITGFCGGTLITPDMVLTAAHCIEGKTRVFASVNNTRRDNLRAPGSILRRGTRSFTHENYRSRQLRNDIAIVQLNQPVFGVPVPNLNVEDNIPNTGDSLSAVGLGFLNEARTRNATVLQVVDVPLVSTPTCNRFYSIPGSPLSVAGVLDETELCAGARGRDTCQGDSGGPLLIRGARPEDDVHVGITSRGRGCGRAPAVYTRISGFTSWIRERVCVNSDFKPDYCDGFDSDAQPDDTSPAPTFKFRTNYVARFKHVLGLGCRANKPAIQISCPGALEVLSTSDDSITCSSVASDNGSKVECTNNCGGTSSTPCSSVFVDDIIDSSVFGRVFFICEGDRVEDVGASFVMDPDGAGGTCDGSSFARGDNFRVAQLGVFCFDPSILVRGFFSFQDFYFECGKENFNGKFDGRYTCFTGRNCRSDTCEFDFVPLVATADVFRLDCIQSLDNSPIPELPEPEIKERPSGFYTAEFRAHWQLELDRSCSGESPRIIITCTNGMVEFKSSLHDTTRCDRISDSVMECEELSDDDTYINQYSRVVYECASTDAIPTTIVEYASSPTRCSGFSDGFNRQKLQLGIRCGAEDGERTWVYDEFDVECEVGDGFEYEQNIYTCFEEARVLFGDGDVTIAATRIETDFRWANFATDSCFDFRSSAPESLDSAVSESQPSFEICFSGESTVTVNDERGLIKMDQLKVGDEVLVAPSKFERVYAFGHRDEDRKATFLRFQPSQLEMSPQHMVFVAESAAPIPASMVKVGDHLITSDGAEETVEAIHTVERVGVYNPFTPSGILMVNGIMASNYISFQENVNVFSIGSWKSPFTYHWLSHSFQVPHRIWCHWLHQPDHPSDGSGMSSWSDHPYHLAMTIINQQGSCVIRIVEFLFLWLFASVMAVFVLIEVLLFGNPSMTAVGCVCLLGVFGRLLRHNPNK